MHEKEAVRNDLLLCNVHITAFSIDKNEVTTIALTRFITVFDVIVLVLIMHPVTSCQGIIQIGKHVC